MNRGSVTARSGHPAIPGVVPEPGGGRGNLPQGTRAPLSLPRSGGRRLPGQAPRPRRDRRASHEPPHGSDVPPPFQAAGRRQECRRYRFMAREQFFLEQMALHEVCHGGSPMSGPIARMVLGSFKRRAAGRRELECPDPEQKSPGVGRSTFPVGESTASVGLADRPVTAQSDVRLRPSVRLHAAASTSVARWWGKLGTA